MSNNCPAIEFSFVCLRFTVNLANASHVGPVCCLLNSCCNYLFFTSIVHTLLCSCLPCHVDTKNEVTRLQHTKMFS